MKPLWMPFLRPLACCLFLIDLLPAAAVPELGAWVPKFKGIDHVIATNTARGGDFSNLMIANALRIDLTDPDIQLLSSPRIADYQANSRETAGMTVSRFVKLNRVQVGINAGFFNPQDYYLPEGTPMAVSGLAISRGEVVSPANGPANAATLMVDAANHARIVHTNWPATDTTGIWTAISGDYPVLVAGVNIGRRYLGNGGFIHQPNPRTAIGLSADHRYLYLLTIDGRQGGYSDGAYDYETAAWLLLIGAQDGFNLDGGGSTTMSAEDSTGAVKRLNRPSAVADSGKERTVGGHLGVFAKPLPGFINDIVALADDDAATITWTTTAPATTQVEYGPTEDLGSATPLQTLATTTHAAWVTGLVPGTSYYFRAVSAAGATIHTSSNLLFTTASYLATNEVVALTHAWRYTAADLDGVAWTAPGYDDSRWSGPGAGLLWADVRSTGPNPDITPRGAELPSDPRTGFPYPTHYFRTRFQIREKTAGSSLRFSGLIDDGAVFYLNGHEIYRLRMDDAPAAIGNGTLATGFPCEGDATCPDEFTIGGALVDSLVAGDNVLAVEVHNYNLRSADITFGVSVTEAQRLAVPAVLAISGVDGATTLSWTRGSFILQQASAAQGPWTDVPGPVVSSPYTAAATVDARYFRLRK